MSVLKGLQPERVFYYFEEMTKIPHGSYNTKQISDFCVEFAKAQGLRYVQDEVNNVIIYKDGSAGYEDSEPVILQGHLDMVCEKTPDSNHDFEKDPLDLYIEDGKVRARGTTLGADNGIAVAMTMAILEDKSLVHPPLEAVFTVDEEMAMDGAVALDVSLLKGTKFINMDSEEEGFITVSSAGGVTFEAEIPVVREAKEGAVLSIQIGGLLGGHSGMEIFKQRGNAHKIMGRILQHASRSFDFQLVEMNGGTKSNVISQENTTVVVIAEDKAEAFTANVKELEGIIMKEFSNDEPDFFVAVENKGVQEVNAFDAATTRKVIVYLCISPNGALVYERDLEDKVETSVNLGSVITDGDVVKTLHLARSARDSQDEGVKETLFAVAEAVGAKGNVPDEFPGWAYRKESPLRDMMADIYEEMFGKRPEIIVLHAGLECGFFLSKNPEFDCVSVGPDMADVHSPAENLDIASVERTYRYVLEVLKRCK